MLRIALVSLLVMGAAQDKPKQGPLTPEEAIESGSKGKLTVQFKVRSATMQPNPAFLPAGEEIDFIDFKYDDRFSFHLYGKAVTTIKRLGIEPAAHFRDKTVRVTGTVFASGDPADPKTPYGMVVEGLDQFEVVK